MDTPKLAFVCLTATTLAACATTPMDRSALEADMPRSVLVLPPLNESVDVNASYSFLSTVSEPLGEMGYYVYPVAVVDAYMKDNGLPDAADMHAVSLDKLDEVFDPDAVLYVTIGEFGQKFELLSSTTRVEATARLVDADSGTELWAGEVKHAQGSASNGGGLLAEIVGAAVAQAAGSINDASHDAAKLASYRLVSNPSSGLLRGPLHPEYVAGGGGSGVR